MSGLSTLDRLRTRIDAFRMRRATRERIRARQRERLQSLLEYVCRDSRFYKHRYADVERPITDLQSLPPVTKTELMDDFDSVVTDTAVELADVEAFTGDLDRLGERFLDRYAVWQTSGTTGDPGTFLQDEWALLAADAVGDRWSLSALAESGTLGRLLDNGLRVAELAVGDGHFAAASGVELFRREQPRFRDRIRLVAADQPLPAVVDELQAFQPAIVVGYSTVLVELARAQRAGRLDISPAYVAPSGERITTAEKDRLRETFGCTVREIYGATEFYALAVECAHGNLHVNTDWVVLEPVDEDYRPVDPGDPSDTVLLTNLANRIQPLVRYDLGDSVTMYEEHCPCGSAFPVVEVAGRQGDFLRFETADGERVPVFPLAISTVVEETPGVRRAQLYKSGPTTVRVRLDVDADAARETVWDAVEANLLALFERHDIRDVAVEPDPEPPARDSRSGKYRHVWSAV